MADNRARALAATRQTAHIPDNHRTNDLIYGHLGRLSYIPPDDDDHHHPIGDLQFSRATRQCELASSAHGRAS